MVNLLDRTSVWILLVLAIGLGIAPPGSQPHLVEKLTMLANGNLVRPIDIFDLLLHGIFPLLLLVKLGRMAALKLQQGSSTK
ncbi:MAG: RND transporter [Gammaproteobacteria bacterium]